MKAAHVIKAKGIAGAEKHLLILLPALRSRGVDPCLLLLETPDNPQDALVEQMRAGGVDVRRIPIRGHADVGVIGRIGAALRETQPDIVHTHLIHADLYGGFAAKRLGLPVVVSAHNDSPQRRNPLVRPLMRRMWHAADRGIAISDAVARFIAAEEGAPAAKITTIHYGMTPQEVDLEARANLRLGIAASEDALVVGMVSRLIAQKGVSYGLRAFARAADPFPNAQLVIIGDGELRADLEREAQALNLAHRAHFLGWQPDAARLMAGFDVFLMPSLWEGFGLTLLEAMAARLPVVASRVSAIPEIVIDGETGYLAPPRDVDSLVEHLSVLLSDSALRTKMGEAGFARLRDQFSVERMAARTVDVYKEVMSNE